MYTSFGQNHGMLCWLWRGGHIIRAHCGALFGHWKVALPSGWQLEVSTRQFGLVELIGLALVWFGLALVTLYSWFKVTLALVTLYGLATFSTAACQSFQLFSIKVYICSIDKKAHLLIDPPTTLAISNQHLAMIRWFSKSTLH